MFLTPRFSYGLLKTVICTCPVVTRPACGTAVSRTCTAGGYQGGYTGWVQGGLYRVYYPAAAQGGPETAKRARKPCRGWSGGLRAGCVSQGVRGLFLDPTLRARSACSLPGSRARLAALGPIRARFQSILSKVSQNSEVSPKYVKKAYHSPYFQNGSIKSPLDFLGFPFLPAFSHKELIGLF